MVQHSLPEENYSGNTAGSLADLHEKQLEAANSGSAMARLRRHEAGKFLAHEWITNLVDPGSFMEIGEFARHADPGVDNASPGIYGDGVITGSAEIDRSPVCLLAQDFTVRGGTMGETHGRKILKVMSTATTIGCPIISINESGGARIEEGVVALSYYAQLGANNVQASGVVPQIAVIMGPCAGGAAYSPALMDFVVMVDKTSYMFVTGPDVLRSVTGESVTMEQLGGGLTNNQVSGNAHYLAQDEQDALDWVRWLLSFLPSNNLSDAPVHPAGERRDSAPELDSLVPDDPKQSYDIRQVIEGVVDDPEDFLEIQALFAPNMICGFGRVEGRSIGIVANQPLVSAGALDIDASEKAARFVQFCDTFNLPLLTLVDVPGYLPGLDQERSGILRRGATLLYSYAQATVPMVSVVVRKAYGGAYAVMGSKHLGADLNIAWPTAEIAVMGAEAAVSLLHRKSLREAEAQGTADELRERLTREYQENILTPYPAAERGYVDEVIAPRDTPAVIARAFRLLSQKSAPAAARKHGNMPI